MESKKIVVIGNSYSAACVFYHLESCLGKTREPYDLILISNKNFYFFKNLLLQCLTNDCEVNDLAQEFRHLKFLRPGISHHKTQSLDIDLKSRTVKTQRGEIKYEFLILAPENDQNNLPDLFKKDYCFECRSFNDILKIKRHIVSNLQMAVYESDLEIKKMLLTFSVIGAQKEGIELVCALSDFVADLMKKQFSELNKSHFKINLIEKNNTIVNKNPFYNSRLFYYLNKKLITLYTNSKVTKIEKDLLVLNGDKELPSGTILFSSNDKYSSLLGALPNAGVDLYLKAQGLEDVFIIGESAKCLDLSENLPQNIVFFNTQAKTCADNIIAKINNNPLKPLKINFNFDFISLGRKNTLVEIKGLYFDGYFGWLFHRLVYIWYLLGFKKKIRAFVNLIINITGLRDISVLDVYEEISTKKLLVK